MTNAIPASAIVNVLPGVLSAGGNPLSLNAIFLTDDTSIPIDTVQAFSSLADVQDWFGADSQEAAMAAVYFAGFTNAQTLPSVLYFAQFNSAAVAAYLRSGSFDGTTLAQLQALSGTLIIVINGKTVTSANINLASATSFSNAAALIQAGLQTTGGIFSGTASLSSGSLGDPGDELAVTAVTTGTLHVGDTVVLDAAGTPVTGTIVSQDSGTPGGIGVYTFSTTGAKTSVTATVSSTATVAYSSQLARFVVTSPATGADSTIGFATGTVATGLKFTSATGAVLSQGADTATAAGVMGGIIEAVQNWATFTTTFEPDTTGKLAFAAWVQTTHDRYAYVAWDSDITPTEGAAPASFGAQVSAAEYDGIEPIYDATGLIAAFICGVTGSIDFEQTQGRITFAFKGQAGLVASVTNETVFDNLKSNGYNAYCAFATANDRFVNYQPGSTPGAWKWFDTYVNQIWLNNALQLAFMTLLTQVRSIPYNQAGYNMLRATALDPINAALNAGVIQPGVTLSQSQRSQINTAVGGPAAQVVESVGWFLDIKDASPTVRAARGSPPMTLYYTDGGSIQQIELSSIAVE